MLETTIIILILLTAILSSKFLAKKPLQPQIDVPRKPFPTEWKSILEKQWPIYLRLPKELQDQLEQLTLLFIERIDIRGAEGLKITDEIRVLTASQACLLLVNQNTFFPDKLRSVIIRPKGYTATKQEAYGGIHTEKNIQVLGQSWESGLVVLSWDNTKSGAQNTKDGRNLVLHEFAHQLDQADGLADGAPILGSKEQYKQWRKVCTRVFSDLQQKVESGDKTVIDYYGATNPAEFFSVTTETFFEKPYYLKKKRPELYKLFAEYYKVDPLTWN